MKRIYSIGGGMFGKEPTHEGAPQNLQFTKGKHLKLFNARSGIHILCQLLKPDRIWIPSHICESVIQAIPQDSSISFYPVSNTLTIKDEDWLRKIQKGDLAIFVDYFGFNLNEAIMAKAKTKGAWILQDAAQALLSSFKRPFADFILYSPRKFLGIPDGGILESNCTEDFSSIELEPAPKRTEQQFAKAFANRSAFDKDGRTTWFDDYRLAEIQNRSGSYEMGKQASSLLNNGMNYWLMEVRRRENYSRLLKSLGSIALLNHLPSDVVPLGFPIVHEKRDLIQRALFGKQIYCPIHWMINSSIQSSVRQTHSLSNQILTLLCDHRMSDVQLKYMIKIVQEVL